MPQAERPSITRRRRVAASTAIIPTIGGFPLHAEASPDPIFAMIDAHRRAYADVVALLARQAAADQALQHANKAARPTLRKKLDALCEAEGPLGLSEIEASTLMAATVPATLPGLLALLRYVRGLYENDGYPLYEDDGYRALLISAERAIERAIG